ncbi:MAG TPA: hypothetical protein VJS89_05665 [Gammaproteobacteria bacterium]|nr:hypothetical protein [Gammaproteobacteria bacterium]
MKYSCYATISVMAVLIILFGCQQSSNNAITQSNVANQQPSVDVHTAGDEWIYFASKSQMVTNGIDRFAVTYSSNQVNFTFPYDGLQNGQLIVRKMASSNTYDVIFKIEKGQIICSDFDKCTINVKFDISPASEFPASRSNDQDSTLLFIDDANEFMSKLEHAKVVKIQPTVFQNGSPVFVFPVDGFSLQKLQTVPPADNE